VILDVLHGIGVDDKKTHSSSIEWDLAEQIRERIHEMPPEDSSETGPYEEQIQVAAPVAEETEIESQPVEPAAARPAVPSISVLPNIPAAPSIPASASGPVAMTAAGRPPIPRIGGSPLRPPVQVVRPPLRRTEPLAAPKAPRQTVPGAPPEVPGAAPAASAAPAAPIIPAAAPAVVQSPPVISKPAESEIPSRIPRPPAPPSAPGAPAAPRLASPSMRVRPIPAGAPLAGAGSGPRAPIAPVIAGQPRTVAAVRAAAVPGAPVKPPMPSRGPGQAPMRAGGRLAGQPPKRPVVPANPALANRLRQAQGGPGPIPAATKMAPLVPGQPIYQRPRRPAGTMPGMPAGPRPMHPTSRGGPAPGAPRPGDQRRGHRPGPSRPARDKEAELEARMLRRSGGGRGSAEPVRAVNTEITVSEATTVKELAEKLGIKANLIIKALVDRGTFATINQTLDMKMINELCKQFGATSTEVSYEEESMQEMELTEIAGDLQPRAPVVTVMGHVDHGKTSLLDALRQSNVAEREAGGITQAIGAYQVECNGRQVVFIDTPGHEAFTRMRARGAQVTDVVILVVAADDGVMPQTLEAMDHAKEAGVPIIVAINKIDKDGAEPERVKQQLADRGLLAEEWGGDTVMVPVSAKKKQNLDLLLEMVTLVSDMKELTANPNRPAVGSVLEAKLDRGQGPVATVLVQNGTLRVGDFFMVGSVFGKVRAMLNDRGEKVEEAPPSSAVIVLGLDGLPDPGDSFQAVTDTEKAKQIVEFREERDREQAMAKSARLSLEQYQEQMRSGDVKELPIILKCDVQGSMEVLVDSLQKLSAKKVKLRIVRSGVGAISESDVLLATTASAIIIGFNVRPERTAAVLAEREHIDIRLHTVIYELVDEITKAMLGLLEPMVKETFMGRADVLDTFRVSKVGTIAGCMVQEGKIGRTNGVRLLRDNVVVYTGKVSSLKRFKDDASEVRTGQECGIGLENFNDVKPGDVIEAFVTEKVAQVVLA
jgi:translation initiation factor IF-2